MAQDTVAGLGPLAGMAANMQAEAEEARAEAEKAAQWRNQMLAGQLVTVALLERIAASLDALEARAESFGALGGLGALLGRRGRPDNL